MVDEDGLVGSLQVFKKLETLEVDSAALLGMQESAPRHPDDVPILAQLPPAEIVSQ